jgi:acyl carrier protein
MDDGESKDLLKTEERQRGLTESEITKIVLQALSNVAPEVDVESIDPGKDLRDQIDIDSVDFLNFVIGIHKELGVEIADADVPKLATLNSCVAYLLSREKSS